MSLRLDGGIAVKGRTTAGSFIIFGSIVVHTVATSSQLRSYFRLTVPPSTPLIVSCAPTAKPFATHDWPSVRVMTADRPLSGLVSVIGTPSSWANGFGPKIPSDSTSVRPPYQVPSCDVSP